MSYCEQPLISVIVPVYKTEDYLKRCIDSILNQTYKNLEIILVDDGSPDNCPFICDEYAQIDSRVKVIHQNNKGVSEARNAALSIFAGKYVTFVDSDDMIKNDCIEYLFSAIDNNDYVSSGFECIGSDENIIKGGVIPNTIVECSGMNLLSMHYDGRNAKLGINSVYIWGKLYKREVWKDLIFQKIYYLKISI